MTYPFSHRKTGREQRNQTPIVAASRGLRKPAEEHYLWETLFAQPASLIVIIVFAGSARLVALPFGGRGAYEQDFAVYAISIVLPTLLLMWPWGIKLGARVSWPRARPYQPPC